MPTPDILLFVSLGLLVTLAAAPRWFAPAAGRGGRLAFALVLVLTLVAGRWPSLTDNQPWGNPDEAHMLAGALTLRHDPVFWRGVDGTTHGPLDQWPLTLASWAGLPLDFRTARLLALGCTIAMLLLLPHCLSSRDEVAGRLGVLPVTAWLALTQEPDFHQLCSEHVPLALLAAAGATGFSTALEPLARWRHALFGALLVATVFAKLQSAPLVAALGCCWLLALIRARADLRGPMLAASLGGAAVGLVILGPTVLAGAGGEFWSSYILANKNYALTSSWDPPWPWSIWGLSRLLAVTGALLGLALLADHRALLRDPGFHLGVALAVAASFAIFLPGLPMLHYWLLLVPALVILGGVAFRIGLARWTAHRPLVLAAAVVVMLPFVAKRGLQPFARWDERHGRLPAGTAPAQAAIQRLSSATDSLAVWGWAPELYVLAQRRQAVREAQTSAQINAGPMQEHYRGRFLADLQRNLPAVFVDAVHPAAFVFTDRARQAHEIFPALDAWLGKHYAFEGDYHGLRVYSRHD